MTNKYDVLDYHFKCRTESDYEIKIEFKAESKMLEFIFKQSIAKLEKKNNVTVVGDLKDIKSFDIDKKFYGLVKNILNKKLKAIENEVKQDKIIVLSSILESGYFKKIDANTWKIIIYFSGVYQDKRN